MSKAIFPESPFANQEPPSLCWQEGRAGEALAAARAQASSLSLLRDSPWDLSARPLNLFRGEKRKRQNLLIILLPLHRYIFDSIKRKMSV